MCWTKFCPANVLYNQKLSIIFFLLGGHHWRWRADGGLGEGGGALTPKFFTNKKNWENMKGKGKGVKYDNIF